MWTQTEHLLAGIFDVLRVANWQRSGRRANRPQAVPRPGDNTPERLGDGAVSIDDMREILDHWSDDGG